jgi:hypothetical protein
VTKQKRELSLHLADDRGLAWALKTVCEHHYLHKKIPMQARPLAYIIQREREWVGCLIFARPQCARVKHWYGRLEEVRSGQCLYTQWEVINLARVYLVPWIQRGYVVQPGAQVDEVCCPPLFAPDEPVPHYIQHAASMMIGEALRRVVVDYLLSYPPAFPSEPWRLRQCLSYCDGTKFNCTLYQASSFRLLRSGKQGIQTYVHDLRDLKQHEVDKIMLRSRMDVAARRRRASRAFSESIKQPTILKSKLPLQVAPEYLLDSAESLAGDLAA